MAESVAFISLQWKHVFGYLNSESEAGQRKLGREVTAVSWVSQKLWLLQTAWYPHRQQAIS